MLKYHKFDCIHSNERCLKITIPEISFCQNQTSYQIRFLFVNTNPKIMNLVILLNSADATQSEQTKVFCMTIIQINFKLQHHQIDAISFKIILLLSTDHRSSNSILPCFYHVAMSIYSFLDYVMFLQLCKNHKDTSFCRDNTNYMAVALKTFGTTVFVHWGRKCPSVPRDYFL